MGTITFGSIRFNNLKNDKFSMRVNKKGLEIETLGYILLGLGALGLLIGGAIYMRGEGAGAIEFIKNILRFGS